MGKIVFAAAMSHVLDPDYYQAACGLTGRRKVEACMAEIEKLGETFLARMSSLNSVSRIRVRAASLAISRNGYGIASRIARSSSASPSLL